MEKKTLGNVSPEIREAFTKALRIADEKIRLPLLKEVVQQEPAFMEARTKLRDLERKKMLQMSGLGRFFARMGTPAGKIKALTRNRPVEALALCEEQLAKTLDNVPVLELLADAAMAAEAPAIAAEAMARAMELRPNDTGYVLKTADYLQQSGDAAEAMKRLQVIATQNPGDKEIQEAYRAAIKKATKVRSDPKSAVVSLDKGGGSNAVGSKSAAILQLLENTIYDPAQAKLVANELKKILEQGESQDIRRKLASCYMVMQDYDKAVEQYQVVIQNNAAYDPALDKKLEEAEIGRIDKAITQIKRRPPKDIDPQQKLAELEEERRQLKLDHALNRIQNYPNDIGLVYDLGRLYLERGELDKAIEQLEISKQVSRSEIVSRAALAECYDRKGDPAHAISELETVLEAIPRLDRDRPPTLYYLGGIYERMNEREKAIDCFQQIYDIEPRFRDVTQRLKTLKEAAQPDAAQGAGEAAPSEPSENGPVDADEK